MDQTRVIKGKNPFRPSHFFFPLFLSALGAAFMIPAKATASGNYCCWNQNFFSNDCNAFFIDSGLKIERTTFWSPIPCQERKDGSQDQNAYQEPCTTFCAAALSIVETP